MVAGEQTVVRPTGFEAAVKETVPENPSVGTIETLDPPELPEANEMASGFAVREKSGTGGGAVI